MDIFSRVFNNYEGVSRVFQGSLKKTFKVFQKSFMVYGTHRSFPSRGRACLQKDNMQFWVDDELIRGVGLC